MSTNKEIVANLELLRAAVEAQPVGLFDLSFYKKEEPCGTLFCTAGLACSMPEFIAKGFGFITAWGHKEAVFASVDSVEISGSDKTDPTFGKDSWSRLFEVRNDGEFDKEHPDFGDISDEFYEVGVDPSVTDKDLALWRLEQQIAIYKEAVIYETY